MVGQVQSLELIEHVQPLELVKQVEPLDLVKLVELVVLLKLVYPVELVQVLEYNSGQLHELEDQECCGSQPQCQSTQHL